MAAQYRTKPNSRAHTESADDIGSVTSLVVVLVVVVVESGSDTEDSVVEEL